MEVRIRSLAGLDEAAVFEALVPYREALQPKVSSTRMKFLAVFSQGRPKPLHGRGK